MNFENDHAVRTMEPGNLAPADGNAAGVAPPLIGAGSAPGYSRRKPSDDDRSGTNEPVDLGPNNERLEDVKPELVHALRELVRQYRQEGVVARRHEIRRIRQARLFWQGLQYAWWNPNDMNWHLPFEQRFSDDRELEEMPRYQFVTNFYQGFGLSFIAVLSQDVPSVRFYPQSAQSLEDISAARAASYVADGQRFGFHEENVLEALEIPLGEDVYVCPQCGKETGLATEARLPDGQGQSQREDAEPGDEAGYASTVGAQHAGPQLGAMSCAQCGAELTDANLRKAERVTVPRIAGTRRVPNGQEVISIAGGLELNTPVWANEMHEYPYLQWQAEVHRAK